MSDSSAGSTHLISPSVTGLGHVCQGGRLPIPSQSDDDGGRLPIPSQSDDDGLNKMELIKQIKKLLKSSLEMRVRDSYYYNYINYICLFVCLFVVVYRI